MTLSGILVLDKPLCMTSHDVVGRVRRVLHTRRVGHTGTLDPDASGVLVVCVGDACRLAEYLSADDKVYEATVVFGVSTDTDDAAGNVLDEASAAHLTQENVEDVAGSFVGTLQQRVPRVSAVHIGGRRAYDLARAGETFEPPVREVVVHRLDVLSFQPGVRATAHIRVSCSKGTYIRSLCRDLGVALSVPAHLGSLRRLRSGRFAIADAVPLADWECQPDPARALLPLSMAAQALPLLHLSEQLCVRLAMGQTLRVPAQLWPKGAAYPGAATAGVGAGTGAEASADGTDETTLAAVFSEGTQQLAAVAEIVVRSDEMTVAPKKVFWKREQ